MLNISAWSSLKEEWSNFGQALQEKKTKIEQNIIVQGVKDFALAAITTPFGCNGYEPNKVTLSSDDGCSSDIYTLQSLCSTLKYKLWYYLDDNDNMKHDEGEDSLVDIEIDLTPGGGMGYDLSGNYGPFDLASMQDEGKIDISGDVAWCKDPDTGLLTGTFVMIESIFPGESYSINYIIGFKVTLNEDMTPSEAYLYTVKIEGDIQSRLESGESAEDIVFVETYKKTPELFDTNHCELLECGEEDTGDSGDTAVDTAQIASYSPSPLYEGFYRYFIESGMNDLEAQMHAYEASIIDGTP